MRPYFNPVNGKLAATLTAKNAESLHRHANEALWVHVLLSGSHDKTDFSYRKSVSHRAEAHLYFDFARLAFLKPCPVWQGFLVVCAILR